MERMKKQIKEAIKDIWSLELPEHQKEMAESWLKSFYRQGKIDGLKWCIDNNKKHDTSI